MPNLCIFDDIRIRLEGEPRPKGLGIIWKGLRSPPKYGFKLPGPEGPGYLVLEKNFGNA